MKRALLLMALGIFAFAARAAAPPQASPLVGKPAPEFQLKGIYGETYSLQRLKGTVLVIQFGTSW